MFKIFRELVKIYPFTYLGKLFVGHERTVRINKHIIATFILKGGSILVNLLLVPMTIHYIDPTQYGIWVTLSSVIAWVAFFDIGLGNGLRNKLAEAFALKDNHLARTYVSTTYAALTIIIVSVYLLFVFVNPLLNWMKILNAPSGLATELSELVFIVFTFFCLQFILRLVINILYADQRPAWNSLINVIGNFIALVVIYILTLTTHGSLLYLGITMSATPVLVLICASIFLFTGRYKEYAPSIKYLDFKYFHDLIGLGTRFFVMQISAVIILSTDNIIISQLFDPSMVTPYNVAYKYFSIITLIFITVLLTPYWSAYTDAYAKKEFDWIRKETKKLIKIWLVLIVVVVLMVFASNTIYRIWIGKIITVPFVLSVTMGLYVIIFSWNSIFAGFINGTGKIQLRMYSAILAGVINIPLSIYFVKFLDMGISGVIVATCVCLMADSILAPLQYLKLIRQTAKGIWDR